MNDRKFRVSSNKLITSVVALLAGFIGGLALANGIIGISNNAALCLVIAISVALVAAALFLIFVREYYLQIFEDGFELVKGKKVTKYPFSAFAGSNVTRHYMNGIYYGTSREISITQASGKPLKINANNLSKNKFAELVTYLGQTRFTKSHDMEATAEYFKTGHEFIIPNDRIIKANKNRMMVRCGFTIAVFVIFLGMTGYYLATHEDSAGFFTAYIFAGIGGVVLLFTEAIPSIIAYRKILTLPNRIYVDEYSLAIGDKTLSAGSILNILMVPASYDILTRDMIVITKGNERFKYNFGKNEHENKRTYADYQNLCNTIELWCIVNKINFMQILG